MAYGVWQHYPCWQEWLTVISSSDMCHLVLAAVYCLLLTALVDVCVEEAVAYLWTEELWLTLIVVSDTLAAY